jgi:hypothetical protein
VVAKTAATASSESETRCMTISSCVGINASPERRLRIDYSIGPMELANTCEKGVPLLDVVLLAAPAS